MKNRHTKTLEEKYGLRSIVDQVHKILLESKDGDRHYKKFFDELPYLGIFYIPDDWEVYKELIYYREKEDVYVEKTDTELYKAKVIEVNEETFKYVHWDDHHGDVCLMTDKCDNWVLEGNIIRKK